MRLVGYKLNLQGMISRIVSFLKKLLDIFSHSVVKNEKHTDSNVCYDTFLTSLRQMYVGLEV